MAEESPAPPPPPATTSVAVPDTDEAPPPPPAVLEPVAWPPFGQPPCPAPAPGTSAPPGWPAWPTDTVSVWPASDAPNWALASAPFPPELRLEVLPWAVHPPGAPSATMEICVAPAGIESCCTEPVPV
jgi:hypothetical protein